ncbi:MAG: hypothetical protein ACTSUE_00245 [Promethearchaeota archaeon]
MSAQVVYGESRNPKKAKLKASAKLIRGGTKRNYTQSEYNDQTKEIERLRQQLKTQQRFANESISQNAALREELIELGSKIQDELAEDTPEEKSFKRNVRIVFGLCFVWYFVIYFLFLRWCHVRWHSLRDGIWVGVVVGLNLILFLLTLAQNSTWIWFVGQLQQRGPTQEEEERERLYDRPVTRFNRAKVRTFEDREYQIAEEVQEDVEEDQENKTIKEALNDSDNSYSCLKSCHIVVFVVLALSSLMPWFLGSDASDQWAVGLRESPCNASSCTRDLWDGTAETENRIFNEHGYHSTEENSHRDVYLDWKNTGVGTAQDFAIMCPFQDCHWAHSDPEVHVQGYYARADNPLKINSDRPCKDFSDTDCDRLAGIGVSNVIKDDYPNRGRGINQHFDGSGIKIDEEEHCPGTVNELWYDLEAGEFKNGRGVTVCARCTGWFRRNVLNFDKTETDQQRADCPDDIYTEIDSADSGLDIACRLICPGAGGEQVDGVLFRTNKHHLQDKTYWYWVMALTALFTMIVYDSIFTCMTRPRRPLKDG